MKEHRSTAPLKPSCSKPFLRRSVISARWLSLEVRVSNAIAQALYRKYGFQIVSTRPRYYSDNNEDAYIMWTEEILSPRYRATYADLKARLFERLERDERVAR